MSRTKRQVFDLGFFQELDLQMPSSNIEDKVPDLDG